MAIRLLIRSRFERFIFQLKRRLNMIKRRSVLYTCVLSLVVLLMTITVVGSGRRGKGAEEEGVIKAYYFDFNHTDQGFADLSYAFVRQSEDIEKREGVKFDWEIFDGAANAETQIKQIEDVLMRGDADLINIEPIDEKSIVKIVKRINSEFDIPISMAGISVPGGKYIFVGTNNIAASRKSGEALVKILMDKYGSAENAAKAGGVIIEMWGPPGLLICADRHTGFRQALDPFIAQAPGFEVVEGVDNWSPDESFKVMSDFVARYGDEIIGIYNDNDTGATEGSWRALELAGLAYPAGDPRHIPIVTYDAFMEGLKALRNGQVDFIAEQAWAGYGALGMELLYMWYTEGYESLPGPGTLTAADLKEWYPEERELGDFPIDLDGWTPVKVVDASTLEEGRAWDGLWYQMGTAEYPVTADPWDPFVYGNWRYYKDYGEYPQK
jgi:ABC-type sugar transport system substrate-binding protein